MMDHLNCFGDCLKELLADSGMSVKELSEKTKIRLSRLYDFLNKKHIPSLGNAIKIADVFGCPLDYLFGFTADFTPQTFTVSGSVSQNVKTAMDSSEMTRYQIHKKTDIDESQLLRWYAGKQTPSLVSLITLADALDLSLDTLAGRK